MSKSKSFFKYISMHRWRATYLFQLIDILFNDFYTRSVEGVFVQVNLFIHYSSGGYDVTKSGLYDLKADRWPPWLETLGSIIFFFVVRNFDLGLHPSESDRVTDFLSNR